MIIIALCALRDLMASRRSRPALIPQRCLPATLGAGCHTAHGQLSARLLMAVSLSSTQGGYKGEGGSQGVYRRKEGRGAGQEELNGQVSVDLSRAYKHQA